MMNKANIKKLVLDYLIYGILLVLIIFLAIKEPSILSLRNLTNIMNQSATRIIIALGIAGIIITRGTDLSAGRQVGLSALVAGSLLQSMDYAVKYYPDLGNVPVLLVIVMVMVITAFISGINGLVVSKLNVTPFIATLGMMTIVYGINNIYYEANFHGATPISGFRPEFLKLASTNILEIGDFKISILVIIAVVTTILVYLLWNKTKFGKNMFAIGGNPEAATVSGVNIVLYTVLVYILAGALYGLAGSLEAARVTSVTSNTGNMYELDAIAAAVVGGVSFNGGIGKIRGVVAGVLIFFVISYGLTFIGVTPYIQLIVKG